jgi:DNA excision repair protein ERCC-2
VRNIDPSAKLQDLAQEHACCVMISGTLSRSTGTGSTYFGNMPVETLSLPNAFPKDRRLVLCAQDVTTAFSMRQNKDNLGRIEEYIVQFAGLPREPCGLLPVLPAAGDVFPGGRQENGSQEPRPVAWEPKEAQEARGSR